MSEPDTRSEFETAKRRAMYLLGGKDYCKNELKTKLMNNYSEKTAKAVVKLMCEYGYVDDERYARRLAHSYIEVKKYGKNRAAFMMKQKGLEEAVVESALSQYSDDDIVSDIVSLLKGKYSGRLTGDISDTRKVIAALARRGYDYADIKTALYLYREELEEEED